MQRNQNPNAYVSEALDYSSLKLGTFNLITAPCGSGKTKAAFIDIPQYLNIEPKNCLVLVNTVAAVDAFINEGYGYYFHYAGEEWGDPFPPKHDKPIAMTYAAFGAKIKKNTINLNDYKYIVCDEIHVLNQYISMSRSKLKSQYPLLTAADMEIILPTLCFPYIALKSIIKLVKEQTHWILGLTATPSQLYKSYLQELGDTTNILPFKQKLRTYSISKEHEYVNIEEEILRAPIAPDRKRLFFFNTIQELQKYKQILIENGRAAEALWSTTPENSTNMTEEQFKVRDYVLKHNKLPDDIQDLLVNGAYETSINIRDPAVQEVYIHSSNNDRRKQVRNRLRQDLDIVGYYNRDSHHSKQNIVNRQAGLDALCDSYVARIPPSYFNTRLYTPIKNQLIEELHFPRKWTSLKKSLKRQGYDVHDSVDEIGRYSIIRAKN